MERAAGFERSSVAEPVVERIEPRLETAPALAEVDDAGEGPPAVPSNGEHERVERPHEPVERPHEPVERPVVERGATDRPAPGSVWRPAPPSASQPEGDDAAFDRGATAPQLRRFIKSRAYVPMHELRRRFAINGGDDDVTVVQLDRQRLYVGLPQREGSLLAELLRGGDIGYELSLDPISPIVVGVYPMRPVTRA